MNLFIVVLHIVMGLKNGVKIVVFIFHPVYVILVMGYLDGLKRDIENSEKGKNV